MTRNEAMQRLEACLLPEWALLPDFGLYMDQVVTFVGKCFASLEGQLDLTPSMINNYVKAGLVERPAGKKYSRDALAQLLMLSLLKPAIPLDVLRLLITPADGSSVEALYGSFRTLQTGVLRSIGEKSDKTVLNNALEASALQLLVSLLTPSARQ